MSTASIVLLVLAAAALAWLLVTYNGLVTLRQRHRQALADIDVQLRQRHDLVPNLVETVKGYASHERSTLEAVVAARNGAVAGAAPSPAAEAGLSAALGRLFALSEAYPDLKANESFRALQGELSAIEGNIAASRRFLNSAAQEFNAAAESFPAVLFARRAGFAPKEFWEVAEADRAAVRAAPTVAF